MSTKVTTAISLLILFSLCSKQVLCQKKCSVKPQNSEPFQEAFRFDYINYTWPSSAAYEEALQNGDYDPRRQNAYNIKIWNGQIYLALQRFSRANTVTLASFPVNSDMLNPVLTPFPDWSTNLFSDDCSNTLQNVLAFEIDSQGVMWVADGDRLYNPHNCPPKIVLLDLNNNGNVLQVFVVPEELSPLHGGWMNQVVVDETDGGFAYITEGSDEDPGIIVYSRQSNSAWKLRDRSMFAEVDASNFRVHGVAIPPLFPVYGIALSPVSRQRERRVYYSAFTAFTLYSLSTRILKNETISMESDWRREVQVVGRKCGQGNGMIMDNRGNLYYGLMPTDSIGRWNSNQGNFNRNARVIYTNHTTVDSPDMFGFDYHNLYVINPATEKFFDPSHPSPPIRILRRNVGASSYLFE